MADVSEQQILDALKTVQDPDGGGDIVTLGMVSGLALRKGNVSFAIEVDPARGPRLESLRLAAEQAVDAIPGVLSVTAVLTAHREAPPAEEPRPEARGAAQGGVTKLSLPNVRAMIAVASGKGGVGKSTVAVNLALGLSRLGLKVGILDADVYGPSIPRMMGVSGQPDSPDGEVLEPLENYGVKCISIGLMVEEDTPMIWRGPMVQSALEQLLGGTAWGELDALILDLPPGTGDAQLTLSQRVALTGAVIVSTPQDVALSDARKGLAMFRRVNVPIFGIVENMSYFSCPHCGERSEIFSHGGAQRTAMDLETGFLGEVPLDIAIRETSDAGTPIVVSQPDSPQAEAFLTIARAVWEKTEAVLETGGPKAPRIVVS